MNVDGQHSLDLSTATKLKDVEFRSEGPLLWINDALETIKSNQLQRVTVKPWHVLVDYREWEDLDRALAQLWTSRSIRPTTLFRRKGKMMGLVPKLLPELTKEGPSTFSSMMTDDWNEDGMGGHSSTFKRQVAYCFTVMSYPLAPRKFSPPGVG